jgi:hypothetical protein
MRKAMAAVFLVMTAIGVTMHPATAWADRSAPFEVWNLSSADITLSSYDSDPDKSVHLYLPDVPPVSTVVKPGNKLHVDVVMGPGVDGCVRAIPRLSGHRSSDGQAQNWRIAMSYNCQKKGLGQFTSKIECSVLGNQQTAACGNYIGSNVAIVADGPAGVFVDVPVTDKAKQAEINQSFCQNPYRDPLQIKCVDSPDAMKVYAGWTTWTLHHK